MKLQSQRCGVCSSKNKQEERLCLVNHQGKDRTQSKIQEKCVEMADESDTVVLELSEMLKMQIQYIFYCVHNCSIFYALYPCRGIKTYLLEI